MRPVENAHAGLVGAGMLSIPAGTLTSLAASIASVATSASGSASGPKDYAPPGFDSSVITQFHPVEIACTVTLTAMVLFVGIVVGYVWWFRTWPPFKTKQLNWVLIMYFATVLFSYGHLTFRSAC
ncbi:hypothetical protein H696_03709 [Fonticula alba]|uniref:Uncharacterized protein n=1 Tax=Fonticula alba TaxID=691883 RepID=A0A058Z4Q8_FONAL|nr:hypothetical protein H696_03709 [Fonticula alba]KCV69274.1 hypothetical protein H696_03709 [Fonticula alba]|eukprot:XP_009495839.1 hypothetical protein H696_03709 [Fonticula alba]